MSNPPLIIRLDDMTESDLDEVRERLGTIVASTRTGAHDASGSRDAESACIGVGTKKP
jgi:hypothetical protein